MGRRRCSRPGRPRDSVYIVVDPDRWEWVTDERDQRVRGIADERDVHRPPKWDDPRGQAARERRDRPGLRIDARDLAACGLGNVQRTVGPDGAPGAPRQIRDP